jgi:hypothetical protein
MNAAVQPLGKDRALGREPPSEPGTKRMICTTRVLRV